MVNYRSILEQRKGQLKQVELSLLSNQQNLDYLQSHKEDLESAQAVIILVAQATQEELRYHVAELVTLALASVFDDPYEFEVAFEQRRNQTEADLWFVRDGERVTPMTASGGGAVDVAAFALRVSLWSLKNPHTRPILILDEPFQHVKGTEANVKCIQMVKAVSERLGLQIIMVSDERVPMAEIEAGADRVLKIGLKRGVSYLMN